MTVLTIIDDESGRAWVEAKGIRPKDFFVPADKINTHLGPKVAGEFKTHTEATKLAKAIQVEGVAVYSAKKFTEKPKRTRQKAKPKPETVEAKE